MTTKHIVQNRVDSPFIRTDLDDFLNQLPSHDDLPVAITVTTHQGGSQRDPYDTAYTFIATWETP